MDLRPGYEKGLRHIIKALDLPNGAQTPSDHPRIAPDEILTCRPKGLEAKAKRTAEGFWVLAGSQSLMQDRPSIAAGTLRRRQELLADGSMIAKDEARVFTRDTRFDSPSAAAAVIYGGNMNGLETWVMKDGRTLKHYRSVGLEENSFAAGHGK